MKFRRKLFDAATMAGLVLVAMFATTAVAAGNDDFLLAATTPHKLVPAINLILLDDPAPTCTDNIKNGTETDIDCGSNCGDCANGKACSVAGDCLSSVCSTGLCQAPTCSDNVKNGTETDTDCGGDCGDCMDGQACLVAGDCLSSKCTGNVCVAQCVTASDCPASDGACQVPACNNGVCSLPNAVDGTTCNDGNECTQADTCQAGACVGSNPVVCSALDQCHDVGTCNPSTGVCDNPTTTDGAPCFDNNGCTQQDTCQSGTCVGANPVSCAPQDECHDVGVCIPATGICTNPNKADGTACSGGVCSAGTCVIP